MWQLLNVRYVLMGIVSTIMHVLLAVRLGCLVQARSVLTVWILLLIVQPVMLINVSPVSKDSWRMGHVFHARLDIIPWIVNVCCAHHSAPYAGTLHSVHHVLQATTYRLISVYRCALPTRCRMAQNAMSAYRTAKNVTFRYLVHAHYAWQACSCSKGTASRSALNLT